MTKEETGYIEDLMTTKELGVLLKMSSKTIHRLIEKREIPVYRIGGLLRFRKSEIQEYIKKCRYMTIEDFSTNGVNANEHLPFL